jgi:hypothetical protein
MRRYSSDGPVPIGLSEAGSLHEVGVEACRFGPGVEDDDHRSASETPLFPGEALPVLDSVTCNERSIEYR